MIVLGLSGGHDANWSVVRHGEVIGVWEKERFTRIRHDGGSVVPFLSATLESVGIGLDEIDLIATSEPVFKGAGPGHRLITGSRYREYGHVSRQTVEILGRHVPCVSVPHHLCHAAYARYSPGSVDEMLVITWDGGGDYYTEDAYCSTTVSSWGRTGLEWIDRVQNCDFGSLWFTYAKAIFGDGNHAGKLMGLAALGDDSLHDAFFDYALRPARGALEGARIVKNCWPDEDEPPFVVVGDGWRSARSQNVASAVQAVTTAAGLSIVEHAAKLVPGRALGLSGGVALNGYLNAAIRRSGLVSNVHVPPAVNDGGISLGAALYVVAEMLGAGTSIRFVDPVFLGYGSTPLEVSSAVERSGLRARRLSREEAVTITARKIAGGEAVGWFEGRAEHGPRALGNRSILAGAHDVSIKDWVNSSVKFREPFRPLAPAVREDDAARFFEIDYPSPWMMNIVETTAECRRVAPGAAHLDESARVQTVSPGHVLDALISEIGKETGDPIVLNTSLNVRQPIVNTAAEAVALFAGSPLGGLYLEGHYLER